MYNPVMDEYGTMWPVEVVDDLECVDVEPEGEDVPKEEREWRQGRTFPDRRVGVQMVVVDWRVARSQKWQSRSTSGVKL